MPLQTVLGGPACYAHARVRVRVVYYSKIIRECKCTKFYTDYPAVSRHGPASYNFVHSAVGDKIHKCLSVDADPGTAGRARRTSTEFRSQFM